MRGALAARRAIWGVAAAVLLLVVLAASYRTLGLYLGPLLASFPEPYGRAGIAVAGGYLLATAGLLFAVWRVAGRPIAAGVALPLGIVVLAVVVRVAVAAVFDGAIYGETRIVRDQAVGVLGGSCCFGHRPLGYPIALAGAFGLFGRGPTAIELLNLAFAALTAWLTWDIGRVAWGRRVGALAATAYALAPSQVLFVLVPLTEPMYTAAVAAAARLALVVRERTVLAAAGLAAALAIGQYVRSTAVALLLPVVALPFLAGARLWPAIGRGALVTAAFLVLMLPAIANNVQAHGEVSVATSAYGGWSLYVGTNPKFGGRWNPEDAAVLESLPGDIWERSRRAGSLAVDRMLADPRATLRLLPTKFFTMWADESYAAGYAFGEGGVTRTIRVGWLTAQLFWVPLVGLAWIGLLADWRDPRPAALLIGMMVVLVAGIHLLLEVHSRYHAYLVPLLCVLAAAGLVAVVRRWPRGAIGTS